MRRVRWPDENRRGVATRYATAAAKYKQELLEMHPKGQERQEAFKALRGLNPWAAGAKFEELVRWMGEFDSARTLVEEWPAMRQFAWPTELRPELYGEREAGGRPPEWMRGWLPLVSEWQKKQEGWWWSGGMVSPMREGYGYEVREKVVGGMDPFMKVLKKL